jgi:hypothetical protein
MEFIPDSFSMSLILIKKKLKVGFYMKNLNEYGRYIMDEVF